MKRIFIGIPASNEIKVKVDIFHRQHQDLPGRWIEPRNLHITLVPPWQAHAPEIAEIIRNLKDQPWVKPFMVKFDTIKLGPDPREPRLIWARGEASPPVINLRNKIYEALGQKLDDRPFKLHMTLARLRHSIPPQSPLILRGEGKAAHPLIILRGGEKLDWTMEVDRFVLYESHLSPQGAEYEIIKEFGISN